MESEPLKILGDYNGSKIRDANFVVSASCNRVAVRYGHTESVSVKLSKKTDVMQITKVLEAFNPLKAMKLPSAPKHPIIVLNENARPQPKLDVDRENGMATVVGRLRPCSILDYKFTLLSNNVIRGAAGAAVLNAELLKVKGFIGE